MAKNSKKTKRQKIGIACMVTGIILIVHFLWLNFYGVVYHEVYSFLYEHFWQDEFDETSLIFDIGDIPDVFLLGNELIPVNDSPAFEIDEDVFASVTSNTSDTTDAAYTTDESQHTTVQITDSHSQETTTLSETTNTNATSKKGKVPLVMPKVYERGDYKDGYMILYVPRLGVQSGVMNGTDKWHLDRGPSLYEISDFPTNNTEDDVNVLIAAHRNGSRANFYNMHKVKEGDKIYLYLNNFCYIYEYEKTLIVGNSDWSAVKRRGYNSITLTSCHPIGNNTHRIVVYGKLIDVKAYEPLV